ncbi:hypothetical protein O3P69_015302 [Scylla paramamosain]|uniref:Microsomal glutathione S-transferase 1 n=1 Tax=Scylla paramamosain TaxID=85552 RepID=A0AAW0T4H1_SCYPA
MGYGASTTLLLFPSSSTQPYYASRCSSWDLLQAITERVAGAHQNDVENIPVFIVLASLFLLTSPSAFTANMLFRSFTFCRVLYTIFYLRGSALRPVFYVIPLLICFYMSGCILAKFW